jgi:hypothetical protein
MGVWIEKILCILRLYVLIQGIEGSNSSSSASKIAFLQDKRGEKRKVRVSSRAF